MRFVEGLFFLVVAIFSFGCDKGMTYQESQAVSQELYKQQGVDKILANGLIELTERVMTLEKKLKVVPPQPVSLPDEAKLEKYKEDIKTLENEKS